MKNVIRGEMRKWLSHTDCQRRILKICASIIVSPACLLQGYRDKCNDLIENRPQRRDISVRRLGFYIALRLHLSTLWGHGFSARETECIVAAVRISLQSTVMRRYLVPIVRPQEGGVELPEVDRKGKGVLINEEERVIIQSLLDQARAANVDPL